MKRGQNNSGDVKLSYVEIKILPTCVASSVDNNARLILRMIFRLLDTSSEVGFVN